MPEALIPVLVAAGETGAVALGPSFLGFTAVSYASITAYALVGAAVVAGSFALNALQKKDPSNAQVTAKQALPPRTRAYGRVKIGGALFFMANTSALVQGFVHCEGPIDAFEEHWFNDQKGIGAEFTGGPYVYPWLDKVFYASQLGTPDQVANGLIQNNFGVWWTDDHRCAGLAVTTMACVMPPDAKKNFAKYYPSGVPQLRVVARCSPVFDPRDATQSQADPTTWKWSDNSALVILDYLTSSRGYAIPFSRIDVASFKAMADLCDEDVQVAESNVHNADGSIATNLFNIGYTRQPDGSLTLKRYVAWGSYTLDEEPRDVLKRLLSTCDGEIVPFADGTIGLRGGAWTPPTVTITPDMIIACDEAKQGHDALSAFNQLRVKFLAPRRDYQVIEGDPWDDLEAQEARGEVLPQDFDGSMIPFYPRALRLAKIAMAKGNPEWLLTLTTTLKALDALGDRTAHITYPTLGIDDDFLITGFKINEDGATCKISVGSLAASVYEWSLVDEANHTGDTGSGDPGGQYVVPTPTDLVLSLLTKDVGNMSTTTQIKAAVDPPSDLSLGLVAQYRSNGTTDWTDMVADAATYTALSPIVGPGAYDVQVAFQTFGGTIGPYVTATIVVGNQGIGPVARALALGQSLDYGPIDEVVSARDDFGSIADPVALVIDLGPIA